MSRQTKRFCTVGLTCLVGLGVVAAAFLIWPAGLQPATAQEASPPQPEAEALDVGTYLRVVELRERLRLGDETLAAILGCGGASPSTSSGQAEAVLARLVTWCQTNAAQWTARRDAVADARKALKAAIRQLNVGLPEGAARPNIPQLKTSLAAAVAAEAQLLATARTDLESRLTDPQIALWSRVRANPPGCGAWAYAPNITNAQLTAASLARTKTARLRAATTSARKSGSLPVAAPGATETPAAILTPTQRTAITTANTNIRHHLPAIRAAVEETLPRPQELIDAEQPPIEIQPAP